MEKSVNILALTHNFPRTPGDHSGRFLVNIYRHLPPNFKVKVIAPQTVFSVPVGKHDNYEGIEVVRIKYWFKNGQKLFYGKVISTIIGNPLNILKLFTYYIALLFTCLDEIKDASGQGRGYNIIHAHWWIPSGFVACIVSYLTDIPYIVTSHGTDIFILRKYKFLKILAKPVLRKSSMVTAVSSAIVKTLEQVYGKDFVRRDIKLRVIPMPYEYDMFAHEIYANKDNTILSIGRFTERKGYRYLIEAFAEFLKYCKEHKIESPVLKLYGFGPDLDVLQAQTKSLGIEKSVYWGGEIKDHKDVPDIIKKARIFVIPSITDKNKEAEGLGIVILEAMASGVPLVATQSGGITDLVKHKMNGYLVPEKDSEAIAKALAYIYGNPEETAKYVRQGLKDVVRFSDKIISGEFQECFLELAA